LRRGRCSSINVRRKGGKRGEYPIFSASLFGASVPPVISHKKNEAIVEPKPRCFCFARVFYVSQAFFYVHRNPGFFECCAPHRIFSTFSIKDGASRKVPKVIPRGKASERKDYSFWRLYHEVDAHSRNFRVDLAEFLGSKWMFSLHDVYFNFQAFPEDHPTCPA